MRTLLGGAAIQYAWVSFRAHLAKARSGELERGASAVEWVVISMIAIGLIIGAGIIIADAVNTKADSVRTCINGAKSTNTGNC